MNQPYSYKILGKTIGVDTVHAGESYTFPVERRIIYAWPGLSDFYAQVIDNELGGVIPEVDNLYMTLDHMYPIKNATQEKFVETSKKWALEKGIHLSEGEGIGHILAIEEGWVKPGMVVPHFDTHVCCIGAIGALGFGLLKEMISPLATNELWLQIPEVLRFELTGKLPEGVMGRDLLHYLINYVGLDRAGGKILEFGGQGALDMPVDDRVTICNLCNYLAAVSAVFDIENTRDIDPSLVTETVTIDLSTITPWLAAPSSIDNVKPVEEVEGDTVDLGIIGTCAGGGLRDIEVAATILKGKKLPPHKNLYVVPSTKKIYLEAMSRGYIQTLVEAGCFISSPTCDFCYGAAAYLGSGKTAISTQTLNVNGRLGSLDSKIYLASAATVASTMLNAKITDPRQYFGGEAE